MIKIKIDSQYAYKLNAPVIASGAVNFVFIEAVFSKDWAELDKTYIFTNGNTSVSVQAEGDTVAVPHEVLKPGSFTVAVKGTRLTQNKQNIEVRATHNLLAYEVVDSGVSDSAVPSSAVPTCDIERLREIAKMLDMMPIYTGEGDNSAVLCDADNKALSGASITAGSGNVAGRKAYYIRSIDSAGGKIYLSETQVTNPEFSDRFNTDSIHFPRNPLYSEGDEFSVIMGGGHYILCGVVRSMQYNVLSYYVKYPVAITFDGSENITLDSYSYDTYNTTYKVEKTGVESNSILNAMYLDYNGITGYFSITEVGDGYILVESIDGDELGAERIREALTQNKLQAIGSTTLPFTKFPTIENPSTDDYTLCVPTKPDVGVVTLGENAFCTGLENIAAGYASVASGYDNVAAGNFSAVFGRHNKAGYAGLVSGFRNIVKGIRSFGSGHDNFQNGNSGLVTGGGNKSYGDYSHTEGYKNTSEGENNHVEGKENKVSGALNSVGGDQNTVTGNLHDVKGQYNTVTGHRNTVRGDHNIADGFRQAVFGVYNAPDTNKVFIVGNGAENNRKNIFTLDASGNGAFSGNITAKNFFDNYLYTFDTYRSVLGFVSEYKNLNFSCYERSLKFKTTGNDPRIIHKFTQPVSGTDFPIIKLRYKVTTTSLTGTASKIYFATSAYSAVSEDRKATFDLIADGNWHDVTLDMSTNSYWDNITQLRLDIPNSSPSGVEILIKYIGLFHDSDEATSFVV